MGQTLVKVKTGIEKVGEVILPPTSWYEDMCINLDVDEESILEVVTEARGGIDLTSLNAAGQTALHNASEVGHSRVVSLFLEEPDAQVDVTDAKGNTALLLASANGHLSCIKVLLNAGADVNHRNSLGFSALDMACNDACAAAVRGDANETEMEVRTASTV